MLPIGTAVKEFSEAHATPRRPFKALQNAILLFGTEVAAGIVSDASS
jgi:hypothetical protein